MPTTRPGAVEPLANAEYKLKDSETWLTNGRLPKKLYKMLSDTGRTGHRDVKWPLPKKNGDGTWTPGAWMEVTGTLESCVRGLHVTDSDRAIDWRNDRCFEVEIVGGAIRAENKYVARKVRLTREVEAYRQLYQPPFNKGGDNAVRAGTVRIPWRTFRVALADAFNRRRYTPSPFVVSLAPIARASTSKADFIAKVDAAIRNSKVERLQISIQNAQAKLDALLADKPAPKAQALPPTHISRDTLLQRVDPTLSNLAYLSNSTQLYKSWGAAQWSYSDANAKKKFIGDYLAKLDAKSKIPVKIPVKPEPLPAGLRRAAVGW